MRCCLTFAVNQSTGTTRCSKQPQSRHAVVQSTDRRSLLLSSTAALLAWPGAARAVGLESIDLPSIKLPEGAERAVEERIASNQKRLAEAEEAFQNSDLLATLKARSEENKTKYKKELQEKYCYRQAELGVGDCGGLRLIPGYTKSGVQKRPEWLNQLFGLESQE